MFLSVVDALIERVDNYKEENRLLKIQKRKINIQYL